MKTNPETIGLPLRDIHLPEPISWWPVAPGWWILLCITAITGILIWRYWRLRHHRRKLRALQHALDHIESSYGENDDARETLTSISTLMRRACLSFFPRVQVAGLIGDHWTQFLSEIGGDEIDDFADLINQAPYRRSSDIDPADIHRLIRYTEKLLPALYQRACAS